MGNALHEMQFYLGANHWNRWRNEDPELTPNLRWLHLEDFSFCGYDLSGVNLRGARLLNCDFTDVNMKKADLECAVLNGSVFDKADLTEANLRFVEMEDCSLLKTSLHDADMKVAKLARARLNGVFAADCNLTCADLSDAQLIDADLRVAHLSFANLDRANLSGAWIHGASVWDVSVNDTVQSNLVLSPKKEDNLITADYLEVAQFIYLLISNSKLRGVIDAVSSKFVLILGRFTVDRKRVLENMRIWLRRYGFIPLLFDFEKPTSRDTVETISTMAHLSCFVIADLTDAKSVLQELERIVPTMPSVPVQPILHSGDYEPGMLDHFRNFRSFLPIYEYQSDDDLEGHLESCVIRPALELRQTFLQS